MDCVICERPAIRVEDERLGHYRDETVRVRSEFFRCNSCNEEYFSPAQIEAHNRAVKNEIRKKYGLLAPERIAQIRKKLGLTQQELEELLGTGPKVVVRWESGKVIQGIGHDNVLRLLDDQPDVVRSLREIQHIRSNEQRTYQRSHENPKRMVAEAV